MSEYGAGGSALQHMSEKADQTCGDPLDNAHFRDAATPSVSLPQVPRIDQQQPRPFSAYRADKELPLGMCNRVPMALSIRLFVKQEAETACFMKTWGLNNSEWGSQLVFKQKGIMRKSAREILYENLGLQ